MTRVILSVVIAVLTIYNATAWPNSYGLVENEDGTVSDLTTSLMWQQKPLGVKPSYNSSRTYCNNLRLGGYTNWRVPEVKEALSMLDYRQRSPAMNTLIFDDEDLQMGRFWVQSSDVSPPVIRTVDTNFGTVSSIRTSLPSGIAQIRCVRSITE